MTLYISLKLNQSVTKPSTTLIQKNIQLIGKDSITSKFKLLTQRHAISFLWSFYWYYNGLWSSEVAIWIFSLIKPTCSIPKSPHFTYSVSAPRSTLKIWDTLKFYPPADINLHVLKLLNIKCIYFFCLPSLHWSDYYFYNVPSDEFLYPYFNIITLKK